MALAPQFSGHRLGSALAPHTLEFYLDYVVSSLIDANHAKEMSYRMCHSVLSLPKSTRNFARYNHPLTRRKHRCTEHFVGSLALCRVYLP